MRREWPRGGNEIVSPAVVNAGLCYRTSGSGAPSSSRPGPHPDPDSSLPAPRVASPVHRDLARGRSPPRASIPGFKLCNYVDRDRTSSLKAPGWHRCEYHARPDKPRLPRPVPLDSTPSSRILLLIEARSADRWDRPGSKLARDARSALSV